ncbi:Uncharacterized protein ChrSV_4559 [Chromobacterium vaccinii]|nr:Uncharacterized protein ChrSW_4559 [Chromobacterium vaccinii]QND92015.1 Uncharacterized protein ChrSV_4559 [Chromobacterium vaccinii]
MDRNVIWKRAAHLARDRHEIKKQPEQYSWRGEGLRRREAAQAAVAGWGIHPADGD